MNDKKKSFRTSTVTVDTICHVLLLFRVREPNKFSFLVFKAQRNWL